MYKGKKVIQIVACGSNYEIGKDNRLLWKIPEEMKFFTSTTMGNVLLMGRKTVESLPIQLKGRKIIKASRIDGLTDQESIDKALDNCVLWSDIMGLDKIFVAGGAEIYKQTKQYTDAVYMSIINQSFPDADAHYEDFSFVFNNVETVKEHSEFTTYLYH